MATRKKKVNRGARGDLGPGRPKFKIDYATVKRLALLQCTREEIASFLGTTRETLEKDAQFLSVYKAGMDHGRQSLRRLQWRGANAGNTTMLVWLGKQYLQQRDQPAPEGEGGDAPSPVKIEIAFKDARRVAVKVSNGIDDLLKGA